MATRIQRLEDDMEYQRLVMPLFYTDSGQCKKARELIVEPCPKWRADELNKLWHSRLPVPPIISMYAFWAYAYDVVYAVALWSNPSARELNNDWIELRRLAIAPDAPHNTASYMIARMIKWFSKNTEHPHAISYQDTSVHLGTIYKAANWKVEYISKPMQRDRTKNRVGTNSLYRSNSNGLDVDIAEKIRWGIDI